MESTQIGDPFVGCFFKDTQVRLPSLEVPNFEKYRCHVRLPSSFANRYTGATRPFDLGPLAVDWWLDRWLDRWLDVGFEFLVLVDWSVGLDLNFAYAAHQPIVLQGCKSVVSVRFLARSTHLTHLTRCPTV